MPVYALAFTATLPASKDKPETFRIKIPAANPAEAQVKLHRFVQAKITTRIVSCEDCTLQDALQGFFDKIK